MSKISQLPLVVAPAGTEPVVVLKDGVAKRARLGDLVDAAVAPAVAATAMYADAAAALANRFATFEAGIAAVAAGDDFTVIDAAGRWVSVYRKGISPDAAHPLVQLPGRAAYAGAGGAGLIGYGHRTVDARLAEEVSILDFAHLVVAGGWSDAIDAARDALPATGGDLILPSGYVFRLDRPFLTGAKPVRVRLLSSTLVLPAGGHGIVLQANGASFTGTGPWASKVRHRLPPSPIVPPAVQVTRSAGAITAASPVGGSGFLGKPQTTVALSPAVGRKADDASYYAVMDGDTVGDLHRVHAGAAYTADPAFAFAGGGAAAVVIDDVQSCEVGGFSVDFAGVPYSEGVRHAGGWWADVHNVETWYDVETGLPSESATSLLLAVDSQTARKADGSADPGPNGAYRGVYVGSYRNLRGTRRALMGDDPSTVTTLTFMNCDFRNTFAQLCVAITEIGPVSQAVAGTTQYRLENVDGWSTLGGDMEDAGRQLHLVGSCNNVRLSGMQAYSANGEPIRGPVGGGCLFDFAKVNATAEPLRTGTAGTAGQAWQNVGWDVVHRQGIHFSGDTWVDASNCKTAINGSQQIIGRLDDQERPGCAMVRRGSQMEWYYLAPGTGWRLMDQFAVMNTDGLQIGGQGLTVAGYRVVGQRQAALPPAATDLPSALALLNALRGGVGPAGHGLFAGS